MTNSSVAMTGKDVAGKLQASAVTPKRKAIANMTLAFDTMKLSRMVTKARSEEWPESEAWKVMQSLTKKYHPNVHK